MSERTSEMQRNITTLSIILYISVTLFFSQSFFAQSFWSNIAQLKGKTEYSPELEILKQLGENPAKKRELELLAKDLNFSANDADETALKVDLCNIIGIYYESISNYPAALNYLRKARNLNGNEFPEKEVTSCNYLGYIFWHQSQYDSAFYFHERARALSLEHNLRTGNLAFTYLMLGNDYFDTGDYVKTSENYFESLKLCEKLKDTMGLVMAHNRLSKMYYKLKDLKSAYRHLFLSRQLNEQLQCQRELAFSYNSLGNIHIEKGNLDSALFCFTETFSLYRSTGDVIGQSIASINLGDTYYAVFMKTKRRLFSDSSYHYYQNSLELNRGVNNKFGMIYGWWGMADNLVQRSQPEQAIRFYRDALHTSKVISAKSEEASLYWKMYKIFESSNIDSSYYYLRNYLNAKTLIDNEERTKDLLRQESKYQIEKRVTEETVKMEQQNLLNAEKIKWKNYALGSVVLISLILGYLVFISIKRMKIIANKNELINSINEALSSQHKEITDSINYARHIQNAILPSGKEFLKHLPESFILYKPKNIVAGDFYWLEAVASKAPATESNTSTILFAAADCTGHGVPGAMVSVICNNGLNRSVREYGLTDPAEILNKTREIVIQEFEKSDEDVKDGMDISLVALAKPKNENKSTGPLSHSALTLSWAGANNPLWIIRAHKSSPALTNDRQAELVEAPYTLIEVKPDKQPIGKHTESKPFTSHSIEVQRGDSIYLFTDGYADQFGGEKGKKFKAASLKKLFLSIQNESMDRQREIIDHVFEEWRGNLEQVDDVCVIGVRI